MHSSSSHGYSPAERIEGQIQNRREGLLCRKPSSLGVVPNVISNDKSPRGHRRSRFSYGLYLGAVAAPKATGIPRSDRIHSARTAATSEEVCHEIVKEDVFEPG